MEYSFIVKHIKGSSNNTADSLSRLPVVDHGTVSVPFPMVHNTSNMDLPLSIKSEAVNKVEAEVLYDVKHLAFNPYLNIAPCTVSQVVGDISTVAAWDLVPLSIKDVAAATVNFLERSNQVSLTRKTKIYQSFKEYLILFI